MIVFSIVIGLLWLSTVPLTSGLVALMFGTRHVGMLFGFVFLSHQIGAFIGVWLGGVIYDATGGYERCGGSRSRSGCSRPSSISRSASARRRSSGRGPGMNGRLNASSASAWWWSRRARRRLLAGGAHGGLRSRQQDRRDPETGLSAALGACPHADS